MVRTQTHHVCALSWALIADLNQTSGKPYVESCSCLPWQAAADNRLRRLCERKPSGKLNVPEQIHAEWAKGGEPRKKLLDQLRQADWKKAGLLLSVLMPLCSC